MDFDPEVSAALSANPAIAQPLPLPPPDTFDVVHTRKLLGSVFNPFMQYYAEILPEGGRGSVLGHGGILTDGLSIRVHHV